MTELSITNVKKNFGFKNILDGFNFEALSGEKIGLIGPNGSGKTTVFKLITREESPECGIVSIKNGSRIAMLSQMPPEFNDGITVENILTSNFEHIFKIEKMIKKSEIEMASCSGENLERVLNKYSRLQQQFNDLNGYEVNKKINEVCNNFKIDEKMLNMPFNLLSGGEKTIIQFVSLVLSEPTILLLDEPTNNLDIDRLEQLENYLKEYSGTVIMSSHDRYFLDKVATKIVLIERGKAEVFCGNYSYYLLENERRIMSEFEKYKDQQKMIEAMKRKIKQLQEFGKLAHPLGEPFFKRAASIQKRLDKIELIDKPEDQKKIPINFQMGNRSGKQVLIIKSFDLCVADKKLLNKVNFEVLFKDKICLMGNNGSGKSTLVKYIVNLYKNNMEDQCVRIGTNISIGYIPQIISFENDKTTILEEARKNYCGSETHLRSALAKFMFNGEDVFKRVGNLSGGEKVRLKLFEIIQKDVNLLIMDEPTNHIDITTKEVLETALKEFSGTIIFISHDRYFINKMAQKILYIEGNNINTYLGNYDDYLNQRKKLKS